MAIQGTTVSLPISFNSNGIDIILIAPLEFNFDPALLSFNSCTSSLPGDYTVQAVSPSSGLVRMVIQSESNIVIPEGTLAACAFTVSASARPGTLSPLPFAVAGMSDSAFDDISASGQSGFLVIGGTPIPTATTKPTETATPSLVATPTRTATTGGPQILIGTAAGAPGAMVSVPVSLLSNGTGIILVGPLEFGFDPTALTFNSCISALSASYTVQAASPESGLVRMVVQSGANLVIPDGQLASCTFTISASAAPGTLSPLIFQAAGMSDAEFNDLSAAGQNGSIAIGGTPIPTATGNTATPTSTLAPSAVATATPTQMTAGGPEILIGTAAGAPGSTVGVPVSLQSNGTGIILVGPLEFTFDPALLTFNSCTSALSGSYTVQSVSPESGLVRMVVQSGANLVIPDGQLASCTFTISASAAPGTLSPLSFQAAGMSDVQFNDITAAGQSGSVAIGGTLTETPTTTAIAPSPTPTPTSLCPQTPLPGCRTASKSSFLIRKEHGKFRNLLVWNWIRGAATAQGEFGNPIARTRYALCVYDSGGRRMAVEVPPALTCGAHDCWRLIPRRGYRYRDRSASSDGTSRVLLRGHDADKSKILFKNEGQNMPDPMLPYDPPVQVQLVNDDSPLCWEAEFGVLDFRQNGNTGFRARH